MTKRLSTVPANYHAPSAVTSDELLVMQLFRSVPPDLRNRVAACVEDLNARQALSGYEKVRRLGLALGYSPGELTAMLAPLRYAHLRPAESPSAD